MTDLFDLTGRVAVITGGGGLLGEQHAVAIASAGGTPVLADVRVEAAREVAARIAQRYGVPALAVACDITKAADVEALLAEVLQRHARVDILVNNAANNPRVEDGAAPRWTSLERMDVGLWQADLDVGLTGAFLCARIVGGELARRGRGAVVNISSQYGILAPDQRVYRDPSLPPDEQPIKPLGYTVVKAGIIGMTRWLATYWAERGVRVNTLTVGGVFNAQPEEFVRRIADRIPMARMAQPNEYQGAIQFLCSDASSFMTGANLVVDGGMSAW
jgi:NAD(P)-dependent dehydrogenase (short-subunit alcohol dehydrogenase family)